MFKLIIEDDEGHTTVVPLVKEEITIGRKEGNTIRLTERNVSRHHARLIRSNGSVFIEDLDSYNGVKVNGDKISARTTIREGDLVEIGDYHFAIQWAAEEDGAKAQPPKSEGPPPVPVAARPVSIPPDGGTAILRLPVEEMKPAAEPSRARPIGDKEAGRLVVVSTDMAGASFPLGRTELTIGREEDCDIVLPHRSVSSHHAKVVFDGGIYRVIDQDSANGVLVNGEEYARVDIRKGDIIELGHVKLRYVAPGEDYKFVPDQVAVPAESERPFLDAEAAESRAAKGSGKGKWLFVGGGAVLLVGIGLAIFFFTRPPEGPGKIDSGSAAHQPAEQPREPTAPPTEPGKDAAAADFMRGLELIKSHEWANAEAAFVAVGEKNQDYPGWKNMLEKVRKEKAFGASLDKAKKAIREKDWDTAWEELSQTPSDSAYFHEVDSLKPQVLLEYKVYHLNMATKLRDQGQLEEANRHFDEVLIVDENNSVAKEQKKRIEALIAARGGKPTHVAVQEKKPGGEKPGGEKPGGEKPAIDKQPKKDTTAAADQKKKEAMEFYKQGAKVFNNSDYNEAINLFAKAVKLDPGICGAYTGIGSAYAKKGMVDLAAKYYEQYVQRCPTDFRVPAVRNFLKEYYDRNKKQP